MPKPARWPSQYPEQFFEIARQVGFEGKKFVYTPPGAEADARREGMWFRQSFYGFTASCRRARHEILRKPADDRDPFDCRILETVEWLDQCVVLIDWHSERLGSSRIVTGTGRVEIIPRSESRLALAARRGVFEDFKATGVPLSAGDQEILASLTAEERRVFERIPDPRNIAPFYNALRQGFLTLAQIAESLRRADPNANPNANPQPKAEQ